MFMYSNVRRTAVWLGAVLLIVGGVFFVSSVRASDMQVGDTPRLITIHDGGNEVSIVTRALTVGDAIKQADIEIGSADIVEPRQSDKLVAKAYHVNVFRARPVAVVDGVHTTKIMTAEQSHKQIVAQAGKTLYDEDKTTLHRVDDPAQNAGAGLQLIIDRAEVITLSQYGKVFEARTQANTVGELLREKGITLGAQDGVEPGVSTAIAPGMTVRIWRDGKQTVTQEEVIAKPIEEVKDADKEVGFREVRTAGTDGKRNVTYEIEVKGGVEVARKEIASVTTLEPVKEVVVVGAKPKTYTGSHADWMTAAGISPADFDNVEKLIQKESGWRPHAVNPSSGACGLVQALPCSKLGPDWSDPIVALRWGQGYVDSRYGGWAGALAHSERRGWY